MLIAAAIGAARLVIAYLARRRTWTIRGAQSSQRLHQAAEPEREPWDHEFLDDGPNRPDPYRPETWEDPFNMGGERP